MNWPKEITKMLGISYPVVQAPMLNVSTPAMVAAVSNNGGMGSLPVGGLSVEKIVELVRETKALTDKPFAVNVFAVEPPPSPGEDAETMKKFLLNFCAQNDFMVEIKGLQVPFTSYQLQLKAIIDEKVPVVSFTFGVIDDESIETCKRNRIILIGTATCREESRLLAAKGIDIICAQGIEAGGHRGSFLMNGGLPMVPASELIAETIADTDIPVIAAGGIMDGPAILQAFRSGAKAVQLGTAFIASPESGAAPAYKNALQQNRLTNTVLSRAFTGRWGRVINNDFVLELERANLTIPPFPIQAGLTAPIRIVAQMTDNASFMPLFAGMSSLDPSQAPAGEILLDLIRQSELAAAADERY